MPAPAPTPARRRWWLLLWGMGLFLFIPVVLYLFVVHPAPVGASLAAGIVLMAGHRFLARPYMQHVRRAKCLWSNRLLPAAPAEGTVSVLALETAGGAVEAWCLAVHEESLGRFFTFLYRWRWPLRLGIFLPLLLLLGSLGGTALGWDLPLDNVTAVFKLTIGVTVNAAAFGYHLVNPCAPLAVPFPVHNFFLLGVRNLLWIFRLVGLWWIYRGLATLLVAA